MAYTFELPPPLPAHGWKAKIRDRERLEPPHVTIIRKKNAWRFSLRSKQFLDTQPDPSEVPAELVEAITLGIDELRRVWDEMYPENPVFS